jgi:hypothetical protein
VTEPGGAPAEITPLTYSVAIATDAAQFGIRPTSAAISCPSTGISRIALPSASSPTSSNVKPMIKLKSNLFMEQYPSYAIS